MSKTAVKRKFQAHANLLYGIITRQANSLQRAVQEGVQNSVDGQATAVYVSTSNNQITIADNGVGLRTEDEIHDRFGTFGMPSDPSVVKAFGEHAMGRGQMMAYGINTVLTNNYKITVNIKDLVSTDENDEGSVGYVLEQTNTPYNGYFIQIDLFNALSSKEKLDLDRKLGESFKYLLTDVFLNGNKISSNPVDLNWNVQRDLYTANLSNAHALSVYNKGVLVRDYPRGEIGFGGTLVSHVELKLTYSRTEIMDNCKHWASIKKDIADNREEIKALIADKNEEEKAQNSKKASRKMTEEQKEKLAELNKELSLATSNRPTYLRNLIQGKQPLDKNDRSRPLLREWDSQGKTKWMNFKKLFKQVAKYEGRIVEYSNGYKPLNFDLLNYCYIIPFNNLNNSGCSTLEEFCEKVNKLFSDSERLLVPVTRDDINNRILGQVTKIKKENMNETENKVTKTLYACMACLNDALLSCSSYVDVDDVVLADFGDNEKKAQLVEQDYPEEGEEEKTCLLVSRKEMRSVLYGSPYDLLNLGKSIVQAVKPYFETRISKAKKEGLKEVAMVYKDKIDALEKIDAIKLAEGLCLFANRFAARMADYDATIDAQIQKEMADTHDEIATLEKFNQKSKANIQALIDIRESVNARIAEYLLENPGLTIDEVFLREDGTPSISEETRKSI